MKIIKQMFFIGITVIGLLLSSFSLQAKENMEVVFLISSTIRAPKIDGYLNESCWKRATKVGNFLLCDGKTGPAPVQTTVYLTYDKKNLYIGYHLDELNIDNIKTEAKTRNDKVWKDDCAEFFLDTNNDKITYYHFLINSIGVKRDEFCGDPFWNGKWQAKTSKGKDYWEVEIAIPFKTLNLKTPINEGTICGVHLGRERYAGEKPEYSSLVYIGDKWHNPSKFGGLIFGNYLSNLKLSLREKKLGKKLTSYRKKLSRLNPTPFIEKIKKRIDVLQKDAKIYTQRINSLTSQDVSQTNWVLFAIQRESLSSRLKDIERDMLFTKEDYLIEEKCMIGTDKQLFIDDQLIDSTSGVTLTMNQPRKAEVSLLCEKPWESHRISCGSVMEHKGIYKMWYGAISREGYRASCYAISKDGTNWERPNLGLVTYNGSKQNNIFPLPYFSPPPYPNPMASSTRRFISIGTRLKKQHLETVPNLRGSPISLYIEKDQDVGTFTCYSSDGIHWQRTKSLFPFYCDTSNQIFWDSRIKKYVVYLRVWNPLRKIGRIEMEDPFKPWLFVPSENPNYMWGEDDRFSFLFYPKHVRPVLLPGDSCRNRKHPCSPLRHGPV